jgi:hypothetical protein
MSSGYAGMQNPLFFRENSAMLFGDAKERVEDLLRTLPAGSTSAAHAGGSVIVQNGQRRAPADQRAPEIRLVTTPSVIMTRRERKGASCRRC